MFMRAVQGTQSAPPTPDGRRMMTKDGRRLPLLTLTQVKSLDTRTFMPLWWPSIFLPRMATIISVGSDHYIIAPVLVGYYWDSYYDPVYYDPLGYSLIST